MNRKEQCRHDCLTYLVERPRLAFPAPTVRRGVNRAGGDFTDAEVAEGLELLTGLGYATATPDGLGSTNYYQATSAGILFHERSQQ